tara:strand:- start:3318 stop:4007 length:690 start_codon:yes stop_codon:yes gene_type:complete
VRLICRYVCVDDPVPEGWTLHKLYGHHGANGYGVITMADNREKDDFYPTPPEATKAMMARCPWLKFPEEGNGYAIWEPACGEGHMSEVFKEAGLSTYSTDLVDRGYGDAHGVDFLMEQKSFAPWIITNPPYKLANEFVKHAYKLQVENKQGEGFIFLLRLAFLEGQKRYTEIFKDMPPSKVLVHTKRLTLIRGDHEEAWYGSGKTAMAWFVWEIDPFTKEGAQPRIQWL